MQVKLFVNLFGFGKNNSYIVVTFTFKGKTYEIVSDDSMRTPEDLLRDFEYCVEKSDWKTIENRIINGTTWGWLKEIKNS